MNVYRFNELYWAFQSELKFLTLQDLVLQSTIRHASALRRFFRERISTREAERHIQKALHRREENFLTVVRTQIYERAASAYLKLPRDAGCELSDLQTLVRRDGLEGALTRIAREGGLTVSRGIQRENRHREGKPTLPRGPLGFCTL